MKKIVIANKKQFNKAMKIIITRMTTFVFFAFIMINVVNPIMKSEPITPSIAKDMVSYDRVTADLESEPVAVNIKGLDNPVYVVKMENGMIRIAYMDNTGDIPYHARAYNPKDEKDKEKYSAAVLSLTK